VPATLLNDGKYGTQVARCWQIYSPTQTLDGDWQAQIASADPNGPWKNYVVISTQWVSSPVHGKELTFDQRMVPRYLSNTTLETYIQNKPIGSCLGCHEHATDLAKKDANFSFFLLNANPN
jgi:hypothetical protein